MLQLQPRYSQLRAGAHRHARAARGRAPAYGIHVGGQRVRFLLENLGRHVAARANALDHLPELSHTFAGRSTAANTPECNRPVRVIGSCDAKVAHLQSEFSGSTGTASRHL
jgi:hypothetical protein